MAKSACVRETGADDNVDSGKRQMQAFDKLSMAGKVAVVTGGAKGMGAAHARLLAARGASVIVTDVDQAGNQTVEQIVATGATAQYLQHDVTSEADWQAIVGQVMASHGKIDALVNNAGVAVVKPVAETSAEDYEFVMGVNFKAVFLGCKAVLPAMQAAGGGSIVNVGSASALKALFPLLSIYSASKAAVRIFSKVCAWDYRQYNIRVNALHPGLVETTLNEQELKDPDMRKMMMGTTMFDRPSLPEEQAEMVAFLCSEAASYITGADLSVDGGWTAS